MKEKESLVDIWHRKGFEPVLQKKPVRNENSSSREYKKLGFPCEKCMDTLTNHWSGVCQNCRGGNKHVRKR